MNRAVKHANKITCKITWTFLVIGIGLLWCCPAWAQPAPTELVSKAFNHLRGNYSISQVEMSVHRPSWERTVLIKVWTRGETESLFTILSPPKDKGNGTLKKGSKMWTFNPKVNRVIKLPPSMMSQAWMGSDFSNNDLAKSDTIIKDYTHSLINVEEKDGIKIYRILSIPLPDAPVVWGKMELIIREDNIMLEQIFFDEDMEKVKTMTCTDIKILGGRLFPTKWRMEKADSDDGYTLLIYRELSYEESLPATLFTLSGLKRQGR